jgi:hypothetical protein
LPQAFALLRREGIPLLPSLAHHTLTLRGQTLEALAVGEYTLLLGRWQFAPPQQAQ